MFSFSLADFSVPKESGNGKCYLFLFFSNTLQGMIVANLKVISTSIWSCALQLKFLVKHIFVDIPERTSDGKKKSNKVS